MNIDVYRFKSDLDSTLSTLFVDGFFQCFVLEDEYRVKKTMHETRIPEGHYDIRVRRFGGFHNRYSLRFPEFHNGMLEICDVQGFTDILIHVGNADEDTSGCLIVGYGAYSQEGNMSLQASIPAYRDLYKKVIEAAERDELMIKIVDLDRSPLRLAA